MNRASRIAQTAVDALVSVLVHLGVFRFHEDRPRSRYHARAGFPSASSTVTTVGGTMATDPHQAQHLREASDQLRELGRGLPRWRPAVIDGRPVLIDELGWELAELRSGWTPDLERFFFSINGTTLCTLAEMMWNVSRGDTRAVISNAESLLQWMGFGPGGRKPLYEPVSRPLGDVAESGEVDDECESGRQDGRTGDAQ